jgi:hypothetical protein
MQIDFLSTEQLQKINESQKFKIILTPQPVNLDPNNKENK